MSAYHSARRAPNVSQYIANLNAIPTTHSITANSDFALAADGLDFLNTEFFDFDASSFDTSAALAGLNQQSVQPIAPQQSAAVLEPNFQYAEFQAYPQHTFSQSPASVTQTPTNFAHEYAQPLTGEKRDATIAQLGQMDEGDDTPRFAAEEDKRRRNTAASARFRVKKKQREQALEKQAKDMADKVSALETKVQRLEMENKWLKGLITEKSNAKAGNEAERKADDKSVAETIVDARNDGVGTVA